jgi:hypothetical protein
MAKSNHPTADLRRTDTSIPLDQNQENQSRTQEKDAQPRFHQNARMRYPDAKRFEVPQRVSEERERRQGSCE